MPPTANSVVTLPPLLPAQSQALAALERVFATRLPDEQARAAILADHCAALPASMQPHGAIEAVMMEDAG